jgi:NifB/MoaA-like Fe-S oxidoreductase
MVFAADEYYLMTRRAFPPAEAYEGFPMHEDGIGMARTFEREFDGGAERPTGVRSGFFAAVDLPANPAAYTGLRAHERPQPQPPQPQPVQLRARRPGRPIAILTGEFGAQVITPLIERLHRSDVRVIAVENQYFGGNTGVTGLLTGHDLERVLADEPDGHRYLLPDVCLSDDGRFLDGSTISELPRPVEVLATDGIALRRALEETA